MTTDKLPKFTFDQKMFLEHFVDNELLRIFEHIFKVEVNHSTHSNTDLSDFKIRVKARLINMMEKGY